MKLQELYKEYKELEKINNQLEEELEKDFFNDELAEKADNFYNSKLYPVYQLLVNEVMNLTKCKESIARVMIDSKEFTKLMNLEIV